MPINLWRSNDKEERKKLREEIKESVLEYSDMTWEEYVKDQDKLTDEADTHDSRCELVNHLQGARVISFYANHGHDDYESWTALRCGFQSDKIKKYVEVIINSDVFFGADDTETFIEFLLDIEVECEQILRSFQ